MITHKLTDKGWIEDRRPFFSRIRQWFIKFLPWDSCQCSKISIFFKDTVTNKKKLRPIFPIEIFGGWITFHRWGYRMRLSTGFLIVDWKNKQIYVSKDNSPCNARVWVAGAPDHIKRLSKGGG